MAQRNLRFTDDLLNRINVAVTERGLSSAVAFDSDSDTELTRIAPQLKGEIEALEECIAATLARLAEEVRKVANGQQAAIALIESLSR